MRSIFTIAILSYFIQLSDQSRNKNQLGNTANLFLTDSQDASQTTPQTTSSGTGTLSGSQNQLSSAEVANTPSSSTETNTANPSSSGSSQGNIVLNSNEAYQSILSPYEEVESPLVYPVIDGESTSNSTSSNETSGGDSGSLPKAPDFVPVSDQPASVLSVSR